MKLENTFLIYLIGIILSAIIFGFFESKTIKIIGLIGIIAFQLFYNLKEETKESKVLEWGYFIIFVFYLIIYTSIATNEIKISVVAVIIFVLGIFIGSLALHFFNLNKSKTITGIILNYLFFVITFVILFGLFFSFIGGIEGNGLLNYNQEKIVDPWDYVYFSAFNFYSANFGNTPLGHSRSLSLLEIIFSFVFHIIILERILRNMK